MQLMVKESKCTLPNRKKKDEKFVLLASKYLQPEKTPEHYRALSSQWSTQD